MVTSLRINSNGYQVLVKRTTIGNKPPKLQHSADIGTARQSSIDDASPVSIKEAAEVVDQLISLHPGSFIGSIIDENERDGPLPIEGEGPELNAQFQDQSIPRSNTKI